eukprot:gnl/MRDRNA2_/MRDRNA2_102992_c0_seq1.p1 gnl/MRDRNA2_/MRDRNA2_102992_c0~~gnl/MRDRNA2_/MRDRNA2_102992_c0_seq1.p1  ORF type:complete len:360 (+),score=56.64 gnl/MRDRNA2_/MRDRNA2_102992_c0_seq1:84-1163(+)
MHPSAAITRSSATIVGAACASSKVLGQQGRRSNCLQAEGSPVLRFGAIADVQYADVDDAYNFARTSRRRYRAALDSLRLAVQDWTTGPKLHLVADLGDMIDQQCETRGDSHECLGKVLKEWDNLSCPVIHLLGNHELYNFTREECATLIPNITPWHRSIQPVNGWRFVILDPYDINVVEKGGGAAVEDGMKYLGDHNPNDLRAPRGSVDLGKGLVGLARRYLPMGGGVGKEQLQWLASEVCMAKSKNERVVVMTHVPLHPGACPPGALLWNYDEVLEVLKCAGPGVVALVLAGHYHSGGYTMDDFGTHHVTLPSPLHCNEQDQRCHCTVEIWTDHIDILGCGLVPNRNLSLHKILKASL